MSRKNREDGELDNTKEVEDAQKTSDNNEEVNLPVVTKTVRTATGRRTEPGLDPTFLHRDERQKPSGVIGGQVVGQTFAGIEQYKVEPSESTGATQTVVFVNKEDQPKWTQIADASHKRVHFINATSAASLLHFGEDEPEGNVGVGVGASGAKIEDAGTNVWVLLAPKVPLLVIRGEARISPNP